MRFKLNPGTLYITDIQDGDLGRLANIDLALVKVAGYVWNPPVVDRSMVCHFRIERTDLVREALRGFSIDV